MLKFIRYLGGRWIGLYAIAFTGPQLKDSYGNYWTQETDLATQRYDKRPLYLQHNGSMAEAGYILNANSDVRKQGLWLEVEALDSETGEAVLDLVRGERGFGSTGVMPGSWRERSDGFIELWPWVELSITDRPATRQGLTRAGLVQRSLGGLEVKDNVFLDRGPIWPVGVDLTPFWRSDGTHPTPDAAPAHPSNGNTPTVVQAEPGADVTREEFNTLVTQVGAIGDGVQRLLDRPEPAIRSLPPGIELPEILRPPQPNVQVGHRYDEMSLAALALWGDLRWQGAVRFPRKIQFDGNDRTELIRALQAKIEKQMRIDDRLTDQQLMQGHRRMIDHQVIQDWGPHIRADEVMKTDYADYGSGFVPTLLNSVLWYYFMMEAQVLNALPSFQMPGPTYNYPIITGGATIRAVAEIADQANMSVHASPIPASKISEDTIAFSAGKVGALVFASRELFEFSAISVAQMWATQLIRDMASAIDYMVINGDETADVDNISHFGADPTGTAYDKILEIDGLRKMAVTDTQTVAQTSITADSGVALRRLMGTRGKFGMKARDLVQIVDPTVWYDILELDAIESAADVTAQNATLLTGMVGALKGVPLIASDELEATNASGQIEDSHDSTLASHLMVNRNMIKVGWVRGIETEMARVLGAEGYFVDITAMLDVQEMEAGAVAYGYNVGGE